MTKFVDLAAQQARIHKQIEGAIKKVLAHGQYVLGPEVRELEEVLAAYTGAKYCITCANGTDALQIALMALGVGPGDQVITPAFSYVAAAEATKLLGAKPVFVDINPRTFSLDASQLEAALTERTKAIIPVSLFGQCSDMGDINAVAARHQVPVIEDAAQSFGATQRGRKSCNLSTIATTSFFPAKPLGCYGDGGAIFTSDDDLASSLRLVARHGQAKQYVHEVVGVNSRLDTIQAAILLAKLTVFGEELKLRQRVATTYQRLLEAASEDLSDSCRVLPPKVNSGNSSAWAQFTIRTKQRTELRNYLQANGVATAIYYPAPLHRQRAYDDKHRTLPESDLAAQEVLSLPMHPYLKKDVQVSIVETLVAGAKRLSS